jgi:single-stranded-DNA-specific exonuclease
VIGIVASRVAERFNRPAILLSVDGDHAKGSGRSIPGFDLLGAVERSAEHLEAFGGHRAACGLRLRSEHIPAFREAFVAQARLELGDGEPLRVQPVDAVVGGADLTLELADELERLAPHGFGNRKVTLLLHDAEIAAPRLTRDHRHLQYRVRCGGASCQAIHFNFSDLAAVQEPGRYDIPLVLSKNDYNGAVSAQVQVKGLHRLDGGDDLCAAPCALACGERLSGAALWRELLDGEPLRAPGPEAEAALRAAREAGRLVDRRGRPAAPALTALAAGGERLLVLVADVARRRPLLERDVLSPGLGLRGAYLQSGCSRRADEAAAADVVVAGHDLALARPGLVGAFTHVALLDPPFTGAHWAALAGAAAADAWVHACWGAAEAGAVTRAQAADYDLTAVMRRVWRALDGGSGRFDDALEQELLGGEPYLRPALPVAAALRALREVGLLVLEAGPHECGSGAGAGSGPPGAGSDPPGAGSGSPDASGYHLERPRGKVDITVADTYRTWHTLFQTTDYLRSCLTALL